MAVSLLTAQEVSNPDSLMIERGPTAGCLGGFVGRVRERRLLATAVRAVAGGGTAGLIVGEPGIGKTALLRAVAADVAAERDGRVLWVRGLESETVLPYAAAADLLTPLRPRFATLPATQRQALEVALALADGPPPNVLATCAGALGVLATVTDDAPLVVVVDDLQWVDPESAQLLLFAARRLVDERVVMLLAVRSEPGTASPAPDLPSLRLSGLSLYECRELTRSHGLPVPEEVLGPVVTATGGNPLAVLETLADGHPRRTADGEQRVAVGGSGQRAWRAVLARLPEATRHALFITVMSRAGGLGELSEALTALGLTLADLEPARSRDLVQSDEDGVRVLHPLLRGVLLDATPLDVRLHAYRTLADVGPPELRPWYLSLGAVRPDPDVAARLVTAAAQARSRRGYSAAVRLSQRAADLTEDPALRANPVPLQNPSRAV